jgi:hypothetical protein
MHKKFNSKETSPHSDRIDWFYLHAFGIIEKQEGADDSGDEGFMPDQKYNSERVLR